MTHGASLILANRDYGVTTSTPRDIETHFSASATNLVFQDRINQHLTMLFSPSAISGAYLDYMMCEDYVMAPSFDIRASTGIR
jgi:hypothetical protein